MLLAFGPELSLERGTLELNGMKRGRGRAITQLGGIDMPSGINRGAEDELRLGVGEAFQFGGELHGLLNLRLEQHRYTKQGKKGK